MTVNHNGASPQFILICISTGGPATTVTWTRDSTTVTEGTETVLDDPVTAQYTHTLTVTGRLPGLYTCTVENNKPSCDSATLEGTHTLSMCKPHMPEQECQPLTPKYFMAKTTFAVVGGEISNYSLLSIAIIPCSSSSFTMTVGGSITLTGATAQSSGIIGKPVPNPKISFSLSLSLPPLSSISLILSLSFSPSSPSLFLPRSLSPFLSFPLSLISTQLQSPKKRWPDYPLPQMVPLLMKEQYPVIFVSHLNHYIHSPLL